MKFKWQSVLIILGLLLAVILLVDFNRRMEELDRLNAKLTSVRAEATAVMQTQAALVTQVAYATSDAAVEQWAYENKWVRVGEHPIDVVSTTNTTPTPIPSVSTQAQPQPTWRIWWQLFFGGN
ncbi:MAG TPA: hypothetical protein VMC09_13170 [Anaerolineales bacterium]|nr:hypothetical protein [Anaerolineales bacterium]